MNAEILNTLKDIVSEIKENASELNKDTNLYEAGQLLAYASALSIIKTYFITEADKIGLDFDIDAEYLITK